jgi:hypothetical protein
METQETTKEDTPIMGRDTRIKAFGAGKRRSLAAVLAAVLAALALVMAARSAVAVDTVVGHERHTVPGALKWKNTYMEIRDGDRIELKDSGGQIDPGFWYGFFGPNGWADHPAADQYPLPGANVYGLIGMYGEGGERFFIGNGTERVYHGPTTTLWIGQNDTVTGDNTGEFSVDILVHRDIPSPPANDNFANAQSISGASATVNGTNVDATRESGEPDHLPAFSSLGENTVWYNWTAPSSGQVNLDTCTSSFDTTLAVYTGSALGTLSQVDSDDDSCDTPNGAGSRLSFNATAGTTYRIAVGGYYSYIEGTFTLKVSGTTVSDTIAPKVISTTPPATATGVAPGDNITATFSEAMDPSTINGTTFKLFLAGTTTLIPAVVTYDPNTNKAILNPNANLRLGTKYKAAVTMGAKDLAGKQLDQDQDPTNGLQQMGWSFTIRN